MGKVVRADKPGVQKIRAKEIVPGDVVEVSGWYYWSTTAAKIHLTNWWNLKPVDIEKKTFIYKEKTS